jgi:NitT/TauT family transport system substrate-binding protein
MGMTVRLGRLVQYGVALWCTLVLIAAACAAPAPSQTSAAQQSAASPTAAGPIDMVVSYSNLSTDQWPVWIALDEGLFARHGLNVDLRLLESSTGVAALLTGETQAAIIGGSEVMSAAAEGAELAIVGDLSRTFSFRFMARPEVRTPQDLRGQRVGVSRFGSSSDIATRVALQKLGFTPGQDIEVVQVGSLTARMQALESGAIQGAVAMPPETTRLAQMGNHVLFDLSDLGLPAATAVMAVRRADLTARRPMLQAFVDAMVEAIALQRRDPERAQAVLGRWLKTDDRAALAEAWSFYVEKVLAPIPRIEVAQLETGREFLSAQSPRLAQYDPQQLIDNSLVDSAVARGLAGQ